MWAVYGNDLSMAEMDYGLKLPVIINGATFAENDEVKLTIKTAVNGETLIEKTYGAIVDNTVDFELTEAESSLLPVGCYVYRLDWYQDGAFMCNIIPYASFKVVDKV